MWQQLENNCIQERLKKCNETISYIAGGDREVTAASEFPRVALCLGGGSSWTTCFSCVGFLDGLSAPIQTPTFQAKERGMGIKLLDAVCMYAASSACACVCGAGMVSRSMGKDCFHHGVERGEDDGTDAQYVSLFPGGSGAFEKGTAESANFIEEQKARLKEFGTERPMKDRFPWVYGREHFFREDRDAYNGLVHKFSQHNLMRCANVDQLSPKISAVLSTIAPNCFGVPSALINEHLGDTTLTRWCNFIANLFIKPDAHQPLNDYEVDNAVIKERVEEGNMPFPILTASDVGEKDTLEYSSGLCEFSPFYIRRNSVVDGVRQDETYEVKLGGCEEDYVVVVDKRAEVGLLPDNEKQPTSYGRFAWKHMLGACCSELPVHLINFEQQHLSYLASQAKRDVRNPHERGLPTLEELDPTAHHRCGTMTIGVRREGNTVQHIAHVRDLSLQSEIPLRSLLASFSGRQFDIIAVHDTRHAVADCLLSCIEEGLWELAAGEPRADTPFTEQECVRVFRGAPGHPTIVYFMSGVSPFKCLEASVNGADIRQMCSTVREKVKDSLSPALLSEIRRCQFQKRMRLADLSPARARLFHPTPVTFLVPGDGGANAADLPVEDAVLLKIFKHRQLLPDLPGQKPDEQTVPNNIIQQILAAVSLPTKGFGPHRNPIEYYNDVELRLLFDAPSHLCVEGFKNLQVQAVDIMCREVARPVPIGTILPFLDEEPAARELLRMLLVTRLFTCADGVRGAADVASLTTKDYIHISNLIKFYSGSMALVQVFAPHTPLLYHPLLPQTASIGDFYRLKWLSLREGDQLVQLLVFAAFTAGVVKDTLNELVKSFIVVLGDGMKNYTKSGPISKQFDRYDSTNNIGPLCEIIAKAFQVALMYYPTRETKKLIKESIMTIYEGLQDIAFPSTLDNWVPINGGLTFFRLFTEACARTAITGDMFTLALDTAARVFVSMNVNAFGRGARGTTYSPLWSFLCFRCMEAMLENPVKKVQYELRRSLQRYFRTELRDAHEESQLTSPVNPTDSFTDETLPLREFFSKDVSDIYEAHRIVLPNLIDRLVYLTLDDKSGFMMVVEADLFLYTLSREILYRNKVKAIESYFVHGCRTVAFLRFMIKVCVENEFYLPFLAPAFYKIKIPSYTVNPQRCEEALRHGMECDRLLEMVIEPTAASTNRRAPLPSAENGISPGSKAGGRPHSPRRNAALDGRQIDEDDRDNFSRGYLHYRVPHKPTRHPGLNHHGTLEETQDEEAIICVGGEEYMPPHLASLYFELRERTERNINEIQSRQSPMVDWKLQQVVNTIDTHYKFLD